MKRLGFEFVMVIALEGLWLWDLVTSAAQMHSISVGFFFFWNVLSFVDTLLSARLVLAVRQ